ncbi:hypothetical protein [Streptomyces sp. NPDC058773]|uniref:hypothetical protein n=1 Tax=Streptomyces sp. NPDC058773 TaxID=3346632 RepID=UPI0036C49F27
MSAEVQREGNSGVRSKKRSLVCGAATLGIALAGAVMTAPAAHAAPDNYIAFDHKAGSLIDTCYEWKGPQGIESKNYCQHDRPIGTNWKGYFPAEATGATVTVYWSGGSQPLYINEADKNHCFSIEGTLVSGIHVLRGNC